jgi:hypothetical protein
MKIKLLLSILTTFTILHADNIQMTSEQEANWQIELEVPKSSQELPLGEFMAEVVTPPTLLQTISLPFEANVQKLYVANYQKVTRGDILADVTGTEWIETQQRAISDIISYRHHKKMVERKNILCKEEIIPKKECISANAEFEASKVKLDASKALLRSYGADEAMLSKLFNDLILSQTLQLRSMTDGYIVGLHAIPGKSTSPSDAIFTIQEKGGLWLECDIEAKRTQSLTEGEEVQIIFNNDTFETQILQLSPVINPETQTRRIRFLVPSNIAIFSGLRSTAKIVLKHDTIKITKNAVIKIGKTQVVFYKNKNGYTSFPVEILAENESHYFVKPSDELKNKIAVTSVGILKNMLGSDNE